MAVLAENIQEVQLKKKFEQIIRLTGDNESLEYLSQTYTTPDLNALSVLQLALLSTKLCTLPELQEPLVSEYLQSFKIQDFWDLRGGLSRKYTLAELAGIKCSPLGLSALKYLSLKDARHVKSQPMLDAIEVRACKNLEEHFN